jgi:hypothetical protein
MTTTVAYEAHRLADLIPAMTDGEYAELREDIAANGLMDAVVLYEGKILDGRHRYRACEETGVWPDFTQYEGDSPAAYVISHNLKRRSLSQSQKAIVASDFVPELAAETAENLSAVRSAAAFQQHGSARESKDSAAPDPQPLGRSAKRAAETFGVGHAQVIRANRIKREDPGLAERVRNGELTIGAAHAQLPPTDKPQANGHKPKPERGKRLPQAIVRIADKLDEMLGAINEIALEKSCAGLSTQEREVAADSFRRAATKFRAIANTLAKE